jgi:Lipocalin-like domain
MTGTPDENKAIVQGSLAYYGTYTIDEVAHLITVKIEGTTFPNFAGETQIRTLSFNGDEVTISIRRHPMVVELQKIPTSASDNGSNELCFPVGRQRPITYRVCG